MPIRSDLSRAAIAGAVTVGFILAGSAVASAHVTISADTTTPGSYALLNVSVPHGCDGSATVKVSIQIPDGTPRVTPSVNPSWDVQKVMTALAKPLPDGHGGEITERVSEIVYTAKTPLPDGLRDAFALSAKLPDTAGETLFFPTVQTCEVGETAWIEKAGNGRTEDDLEHPAPAFTLATDETEPVDDNGGAPAAVSWIALALGAIGAALGGFAVLRSRPTSS